MIMGFLVQPDGPDLQCFLGRRFMGSETPWIFSNASQMHRPSFMTLGANLCGIMFFSHNVLDLDLHEIVTFKFLCGHLPP